MVKKYLIKVEGDYLQYAPHFQLAEETLTKTIKVLDGHIPLKVSMKSAKIKKEKSNESKTTRSKSPKPRT